MSDRCYIYLIPGFFGFADLGGITYFHHVREMLEERCALYGMDPEVHYVSTVPTGSIRMRAAQLYHEVAATATEPDWPIHLIGHSTGGLDARLFVSPNVSLLKTIEAEVLASRVKSVVSVATPHLGTPLAFFFNSLLGQKLLYLISLATIYALRFGKFPLSTLFSLVGIITRLDDHLGWKDNIVDQFYENLFSDLSGERMVAVGEFLESIRSDQALLGQLTPGGIDLLNAAVQDRPGTRYGCVVTQARRPELGSLKDIGLEPYKLASHTVYRFLYWLTSFVPNYPDITEAQRAFLQHAYGSVPECDASDGVVPTWSQLHGELIRAMWADHLDVCGHFSEPGHDPPHIDWLSSGTGFSRSDFEGLWSDVVAFMMRDQEDTAIA